MEAASGRAERTYGNLRHPKSAGLWHFGTIGTALVFGAIMVWILVVIFVGILPGLVLFALFVPTTVYLTVPDRHRQTRLEKLAVKIGHKRQRAQGSHVYESGPAGRVPTGRFSLPGILAPTALVETEDGYGRRVGVIHHRSTGGRRS